MHTLNIQNNDTEMGRTSAGLTARNVAEFNNRKPEYSNGHHRIHRTSPALNPQHRSESPSASNGAPPALPPRSRNVISKPHREPPDVPPSLPITTNGDHHGHQTVSRKYSPNQQNGGVDIPPPPPPREQPKPPPTPPRCASPSNTRGGGLSAPPTNNSMVAQYSNSPIATTLNQPPLMKRISPVPTQYSRTQGGMIVASACQRGTSPVTTGTPIKVHNTREIQQQFKMMHPFDNVNPVNAEPPPPYPMVNTNPEGIGNLYTNPNPPPSYSQALANRQSPTLSSTSSDYRLVQTQSSKNVSSHFQNYKVLENKFLQKILFSKKFFNSGSISNLKHTSNIFFNHKICRRNFLVI